jgi:hypothetical protein
MTGHETQGTESGLLGAFEFKGACTAGDGSCDTGSLSLWEQVSATLVTSAGTLKHRFPHPPSTTNVYEIR